MRDYEYKESVSREVSPFWHYLRTRSIECWGFLAAGVFIGKIFF